LDGPATLPVSPPPTRATEALWPTGEKAQLSDSKCLPAALNDPVQHGPGMRAIVVVHDGRIVGETYGRSRPQWPKAPRRRGVRFRE